MPVLQNEELPSPAHVARARFTIGQSKNPRMTGSKRFRTRAGREINRDSFIHEWPESGLVLFNSPADPKPQIRIKDGRIIQLDGRPEAEFDILDRFIAWRAIDTSIAQQAMAMDSLEIA